MGRAQTDAISSPKLGRREPAPDPPRPLRPSRPRAGPERVESWPDGDWVVRRVPGAASAKAYRCPGCDHEIVPGTPHVVAWPADGSRMPGGIALDERRHWHTACWKHRLRRGPDVKRRGVP